VRQTGNFANNLVDPCGDDDNGCAAAGKRTERGKWRGLWGSLVELAPSETCGQQVTLPSGVALLCSVVMS